VIVDMRATSLTACLLIRSREFGSIYRVPSAVYPFSFRWEQLRFASLTAEAQSS
jgi:hypothetical protein